MIDVQFPDMWLLNLRDVQIYLGLTDAEAEGKQSNLLQAARQASVDVIAYLNRIPLPHVRTMEYEPPRTRFLAPGGDLLEVVEFLNPQGEVLATTDYRLKPLNSFPKSLVEITKTGCGSWQTWCSSQYATLQLTGRFGYAPHWPYAWETVMQATLAAGANTLAVADLNLFSVGDTLRLEDEYLFVRAIALGDPSPTGTLTLRRGALGTTAAAHDSSTALDRFLVLDVIRSNAIEWAAYLEKARGRVGERVQVSETGLLVVNDLSPIVRETLQHHVYNPVAQLP